MRVIVAGGTGFIGRRLVTALNERGHEVVVLSRSRARAGSVFGDEAGAEKWDARTAKGWVRLLDRAEEPVAIVNLTGENLAGRWTPEKKRRIVDSRVNSGKAVAEAVERAEVKPAVLVQGSAVGFYGPRGEEVVNERSDSGAGFLAEICRKWESSSESVEEHGVRRVVARTGIVLGNNGILGKFLTPFKFFLGGPLGGGEQWMSWVHMEDEVEGIIFLLENESADGPFNLCSPHPVRMEEFTKILGRVMNRPSWLKVPKPLLRAALGEMAEEMVLSGQRVEPKKLLEMDFEFRYPSLEGAFKEILSRGNGG
jgi:uncharacterized protein (TIGR01777 family)